MPIKLLQNITGREGGEIFKFQSIPEKRGGGGKRRERGRKKEERKQIVLRWGSFSN